MNDPTTWPPEQVRAWIDRHGGNLTACARRLRVHRTELQGWVADPEQASSARPLSAPVQAHMETLDRYELGVRAKIKVLREAIAE